jgi:hypothetical protein
MLDDSDSDSVMIRETIADIGQRPAEHLERTSVVACCRACDSVSGNGGDGRVLPHVFVGPAWAQVGVPTSAFPAALPPGW